MFNLPLRPLFLRHILHRCFHKERIPQAALLHMVKSYIIAWSVNVYIAQVYWS
jgi:hypothetical protein